MRKVTGSVASPRKGTDKKARERQKGHQMRGSKKPTREKV